MSLQFIPKGRIENNCGSYNDLSPNRQQAIIWTDNDLVTDTYMRLCPSTSIS